MASVPGTLSADGEARAYWLSVLDRLARPVLGAAAYRRLASVMPVEVGPLGDPAARRAFSHSEAICRVLAGVAPWLEFSADGVSPDELALRSTLAEQAVAAIASGTDPSSPDFIDVDAGPQVLVEAGFLAVALLRAPEALWEPLGSGAQSNVVRFLVDSRRVQPYANNWLLFPAAVEAALLRFGYSQWDPMRIGTALRQFNSWYVGDGTYSDGVAFKADHYNGLVIHPFLIEVVEVAAGHVQGAGTLRPAIRDRLTRFAEIQERLIAPDGSYPPIGRSLAYRCGVFHALAQAALRGLLPAIVSPAQVRSALTAVLRRQMEAPGAFDESGWLRIGLVGHQPSLGESYISTGSLYLVANALLPLGLGPADAFWSSPDVQWTSQRAWSGVDLAADAGD